MSNNNYIHVEMDTFQITNKDNNIIGCDSLISCFGILLYNENDKIAGVLHKSIDGYANDKYIIEINSNLLKNLSEQLKIVEQNDEFKEEKIKYLIIPPAMYSDKTSDYLNLWEYLLQQKGYTPFLEEELNDQYFVTIQIGQNEFINCFAFDTSIGNFITKEIFKDENIINNLNIKK